MLFKYSCLLLLLGTVIVARPRRQNGPKRTGPNVDPIHYLHKFGYLPTMNSPPGHVRKALMMVQKFMGLPMTGETDKATMDMMVKPRCGVEDMKMKEDDLEDIPESEAGVLEKLQAAQSPMKFTLFPGEPTWNKRHLTYKFINFTPKLSEGEVRDAVYEAFQLWSSVTTLTFSEARWDEEADIRVEFNRWYHGDGYPFDEAGGYAGNVLAHAFAPGESAISGDMHFDDYEPWTVNTDQGVNLFFVAVHELGHALGLSHSSVPDSIMFPSYGGYRENLKLHYDDIEGIQYLYGINMVTDPPRPTECEGGKVFNPCGGCETTCEYGPEGCPMVCVPRCECPRGTLWSGQDERCVVECPTVVPPPTAPNPCHVSLDAATLMRRNFSDAGTIIMFHRQWFWQRDFNNMIDVGSIHDKWPGLPPHLTHIDAAYQRRDGRFIMFSGKRYWIFHGTKRDFEVPRHGNPITDFGLPTDLEKVDAVFTWGFSKSNTYIVSGDQYWKLGFDGKVETNYPMSMVHWDGVPTPLDAGFRLWDGRTYFLKDQDTYVLDDRSMKVKRQMEGTLGSYWLWCSN